MTLPFEDDFARFLAHKRAGGVPLTVGVSAGVWLGGILEERGHEPFVYVGPSAFESDDELTFFADHDAVEAFVAQLRAAARAAWGAPR